MYTNYELTSIVVVVVVILFVDKMNEKKEKIIQSNSSMK